MGFSFRVRTDATGGVAVYFGPDVVHDGAHDQAAFINQLVFCCLHRLLLHFPIRSAMPLAVAVRPSADYDPADLFLPELRAADARVQRRNS